MCFIYFKTFKGCLINCYIIEIVIPFFFIIKCFIWFHLLCWNNMSNFKPAVWKENCWKSETPNFFLRYKCGSICHVLMDNLTLWFTNYVKLLKVTNFMSKYIERCLKYKWIWWKCEKNVQIDNVDLYCDKLCIMCICVYYTQKLTVN